MNVSYGMRWIGLLEKPIRWAKARAEEARHVWRGETEYNRDVTPDPVRMETEKSRYSYTLKGSVRDISFFRGAINVSLAAGAFLKTTRAKIYLALAIAAGTITYFGVNNQIQKNNARTSLPPAVMYPRRARDMPAAPPSYEETRKSPYYQNGHDIVDGLFNSDGTQSSEGNEMRDWMHGFMDGMHEQGRKLEENLPDGP